MKRIYNKLPAELQVGRIHLIKIAKKDMKFKTSEIAKIMGISREAVRKILLKRTK